MKILQTLTLSAAVLVAATAVHADDHKGKHEGKGYMAHIDTNNDGKISRAEYIAAAEARFKKMDKDGDGFITKEERNEARAHMKEKHKEKRGERKERKAE